MGQNFLVQSLGARKIDSVMDVLVEDNVGEGIHIHFRFKNGFDLRLEFTVAEFRQFCRSVQRSAEMIRAKGNPRI